MSGDLRWCWAGPAGCRHHGKNLVRGLCSIHYQAWYRAGMPAEWRGQAVPSKHEERDPLLRLAAAGVTRAELADHLAGCGTSPDFEALIAESHARRAEV